MSEVKPEKAKGYARVYVPGTSGEERYFASQAIAHVFADKMKKQLVPSGFVSVYERADDGVWVLKRTEVYEEPKAKRPKGRPLSRSRANLRLVK